MVMTSAGAVGPSSMLRSVTSTRMLSATKFMGVRAVAGEVAQPQSCHGDGPAFAMRPQQH